MICGKLEACVERTVKGHLPDKCDNRKENCIEFSDTRMHAKCEEKKKKYRRTREEGKAFLFLWRKIRAASRV